MTEGPALPRYKLEVVRGLQTGSAIVCDEGNPSRMLVGTSATCALRLSDVLVSRRHLAVEVTRDGLHIVDLHSKSGTLVDGLLIREVWLSGDETIALGDTLLRVTRLAVDSVAPPSTMVSFGRMLGASPAMRRLYPLCERLAKSELPILVEGEAGTGKELLAEVLHESSARAGGPFVVFDCGAVPEAMAESALFGHEQGPFTAGELDREGVFEAAHGGTLFLDELGELPLEVQPKLLRAIDNREIKRVGSNQWMSVDVRVISATRRDVDRAVQERRFREDLFYRLAVARIEVPPLRHRLGDVALLAHHFWRDLSRNDCPIPHDLARRLEAWHWPGNVRELHQTIARHVALANLDDRAAGNVSPVEGEDVLASVLALELPLAVARALLVDAFERQYVNDALTRHRGSVAGAAMSTGLARRSFQLLRTRRGTNRQ